MYQEVPGHGDTPPFRLAPHETLELHELLAYKSVGLVKMKQGYGSITDPALRQLCVNEIRLLERHIQELMHALQYRAIIR